MNTWLVPLLITAGAGLATVMGSLVVFSKVSKNGKLVSWSLAFASGIMLMIALGHMVPESIEVLSQRFGRVLGIIIPMILVAAGVVGSLLLDDFLPHHHEDHVCDHGHVHEHPGHYVNIKSQVTQAGYGMIVGLILHNVIEGMAIGMTTASDLRMGIGMALAIAFHNIPIGMTLALPVTYGTGKKSRAVVTALTVGLTQPLGAVFGILVMNSVASTWIISLLMALVAGILIFITFDELWPAAQQGMGRTASMISLLAGIAFILIAELFLS